MNPDLESVTTYTIAEQRFEQSTDTALVFYNVRAYEGKEIPFPQMKEEVETYFAEHLMRPTRRVAYFDGDDWYHESGVRYSSIFREAIETAANEKIKKRFEAEETGWKNAGEVAMRGEQLPFVILSAPGDVYRNPNFGAKSMTYIALPTGMGKKVLGREEKNVYEYQVYSIPSSELSIDEHMELADPLIVNIEEWEEAKELACKYGENYLVENSFVVTGAIEAMNHLAGGLGFENFEEIEKQAMAMLEVQNDPLAKQRRERMVDLFANLLKDENESVWNSEETRMIKMSAVADVMHYYFALEAGAQFVGQQFEEIEQEIAIHIQDKIESYKPEKKRSENYLISSDYERALRDQKRMQILRSNTRAFESYMVTGCVINTSQTSNVMGSRQYGVETITRRFGYESNQTNETQANSNQELDLGEYACYNCPMCGGWARRDGKELVCQRHPDAHKIYYVTAADQV